MGSTDSFAFDEFGQPATWMFIVKLSNGAVTWQRSQAPPYSLLPASLKLSAPKFTVATPPGELVDPEGTVSIPQYGASEPAGSTSYSGNFEAALIGLTLP